MKPKEYKVTRHVVEIDNTPTGYVNLREININATVEDLNGIGIKHDEGDVFYYGHYTLSQGEVLRLEQFMYEKTAYDFDKYIYVLGCWQA